MRIHWTRAAGALLALAIGGCAAPAPPAAPERAGMCFPPEVQARCRREGGCTLFSDARLAEIVLEIAQDAVQEACGRRL